MLAAPNTLTLDVTSASPSTPSPLDQHAPAVVLLPSTSTSSMRLSRPEPLPLASSSSAYLPKFLGCSTTDIGMASSPSDDSSSSSSPSSDISELSTDSSASSPDDTALPELPRPPTLSFQVAAADAASNIQYVMDKFPSDMAYIADPFKKEPLEVESGERVELLEELPNFVMRVRVVRKGIVGLLPAWNLEDPFERLARLNMEFNEAVTCPAEVQAKNDDSHPASCALAHAHSRCPTQTAQTRRQFVHKMRKLERENGSSFENSLPTTPDVEPLAAPPSKRTTTTLPPVVDPKPKSVKFTGTQRKVVFRYYLPADLNKKEKRSTRYDSDSESDNDNDHEFAESDMAQIEDENVAWWWDGWEEDPDAVEAAAAAAETAMTMPKSVVTVGAAAPSGPPDSKPNSTPSGQEDSESRRGRPHRFRGRIRINNALKVIFQ